MARRGHGEGSISRRADGRWEAKVSLGYTAGRRLRKAFYGVTRAEVQVKLRAALKARDEGLPILADDRTTVERYLLRWLEATGPNVRPKTAAHFRWCVTHLIEGLGGSTLKQLGVHDVQIFLNRKARTMSPQSVHHFRATLRLALNTAMLDGFVVRNVAALAKAPEMVRPEIRPLNAEQARVLIDRWREDQHGALYVTALLLGLRQGEALGLRWSDVSLESEGGFRVRVTKTATGRTKTAASIRTLTMPPTLVAVLREHRETSVRSLAGYVFPSQKGGPLDGTNVTHRFQRFLRAVGLPHMRFHDLRHGFATMSLESGVSLKTVSALLGHASIAITADTYAHVLEHHYEDAANRMEAFLAGAGKR